MANTANQHGSRNLFSTTVMPLLVGIVLLAAGGELLVRGAVTVAERLGISALLIGLTLIGFGTSAPELVTSVEAARTGAPGIAYGNIVGSNIANVLIILALSALLTPVPVGASALRRDGSVVVLSTLLFVVVAASMPMTRPIGWLFLACLVAYLVYAYQQERNTKPIDHVPAGKAEAFEIAHPGHEAHSPSWRASTPVALLMALAGLALIVVGGSQLVKGAVSLARTFGMSEAVIGLTIVAIGTSMPELVTSLVAAYKGHSEIALGNVLGSNIYNILGIGGVTAVVAPSPVPAEIVQFDNFVLLAVTLALLVVSYTGRVIGRTEGLALVLGYFAYVWVLLPK